MSGRQTTEVSLNRLKFLWQKWYPLQVEMYTDRGRKVLRLAVSIISQIIRKQKLVPPVRVFV